MIRSVLLKRFSLRVVTESLGTSRALSAAACDLFQEECLCQTQLILIFSQYLRLQKYRLHFAEQTEEDLSMCICFVMFRCSVAVMGGVFTLLHVRGYI